MQRRFNGLLLLGFLTFSLLTDTAAFAQFRSVHIGVNQRPQPDDSVIYELTTIAGGHTLFGVPLDALTLTRPDGTVLARQSDTQYASFGDLAADLFGDWIVTEDPTTGPNNTYTLRIAPFTLSDVFSATPEIISPTPGSNVQKNFVVKWDTHGFTSGGGGISFGGPGVSILNYESGVDGASSVAFETELLQPAPVPFLFETFTVTNRPSPSVLNRSSGVTGRIIIPTVTFRGYSLRATYFVAPEPSFAALATVATIAFGSLRSRCRTFSF